MKLITMATSNCKSCASDLVLLSIYTIIIIIHALSNNIIKNLTLQSRIQLPRTTADPLHWLNPPLLGGLILHYTGSWHQRYSLLLEIIIRNHLNPFNFYNIQFSFFATSVTFGLLFFQPALLKIVSITSKKSVTVQLFSCCTLDVIVVPYFVGNLSTVT